MIHVDRLPKPNILVRKEKEWTEKFLASGKGPDNSKYRHKEILTTLNSMSYHKCFYCEQMLKGIPREIDHFIEVSDPKGKELAFVWNNLYLSCNNCNNKINNITIPVTEVLDPCKHTDEEIQKHITFEKEIITSKNNSAIGLKTIQKYKLGEPLLDYLRLKQFDLFKDVLLQISNNQNADDGRKMNEQEKEKLKRFAQKDRSFSLMFRILLMRYNIT